MFNDEQLDYISKDIKLFIVSSINIMILASYLQINLKDLLLHTNSKLLKSLYFLLSPIIVFSNVIIKNKK